jgi:hypothetical protein
LGDDLFGGFEFVETGGEPIGVICVVGEKLERGERGAGLRGVVGEGGEVVAFERFLEAGGEFVPLRARGEFILGLDLGRGELVEELLAELKEFVGRRQRGLGRGGSGDRCGLRNGRRGREGEGEAEE